MNLVLSIIFCIVCVALAGVVLFQEGNSQGLGAVNGVADTYWGKNKGRSVEGKIKKATMFLAIAFLALAFILNII